MDGDIDYDDMMQIMLINKENGIDGRWLILIISKE